MKNNRSSINYTLEATSYDDNIIEIIPESERFIVNRLGYKIEVKNHEGDWFDRISIADDNGGTIHIKNIRSIRTNDHELNMVLQSIIKRTIEIYLPDTVDLLNCIQY